MANLKLALDSVGQKEKINISILSGNDVDGVKRIVRPFIFFSSKKRSIIENIKKWLLLRLLCIRNPKVVICNSVEDFCLLERLFSGRRERNFKLGLMSHSPIWPSKEREENGASEEVVRHVERMEVFAVSNADFIIAPSQHAMDAYIVERPEFGEIIASKLICVETGVCALKSHDCETLKKKVSNHNKICSFFYWETL